MTNNDKLFLFVVLLIMVAATLIQINDVKEFEQKCKDAGGIVSHNRYECFHPSALIKTE